ncbi:MAG: hypothetical protein K8W52_27190 [Deltaproteobacteria bacterium]|nr:hypothetical protein [Deltaproteobacteria bacterium]
MVKDRARPFSRKHRRYWLTITGGMIVIGAINLALGVLLWPHSAEENLPPKAILFDVPQVTGTLATYRDAGAPPVDAAPLAP